MSLTIAPHEPASLLRRYRREVRAAASSWLGRGEAAGQNNRGPDVDEMLAISGVGRRDRDGHSVGGPWCGVGASAMLTLGARAMGWLAPPFAMHAGAKRLGRNVGRWGRFVVAPRGWTILGGGTYLGDPGIDESALIVVWHRGMTRETAWSGHVEIVSHYEQETDSLWTFAPNVVPRQTARGLHGLTIARGQAVWHQREHRNGRWRRKLYAIAAV
ncbi:hypothetical protein LCGC14_0678360 [marine sediment metagenome]|uniref:Uncharacterized protein n=2 Tax=root TaxID=1 RepID=A0A9C9NJA7_9HYPH|nr:hypothetical protein [Aurantimonas coralicida]